MGLHALVLADMLKVISDASCKTAPKMFNMKDEHPEVAEVADKAFEDIEAMAKKMDHWPGEVAKVESAFKKLEKAKATYDKAAKSKKK
jgi:inorganic pyrophosphatase